jgi:membrane protein DedA with SNARE-associated domain
VESVLSGLADYVARYGYWAVAAALLLENAGLPVPGETVLVAASALAHAGGRLHLPQLILVGSLAATIGDNIGYALGRSGGRRLLDRSVQLFRVDDGVIARGERLFARHGAAAIFFARYVAGLRVVAGPLAGVLRMPWRSFAVFNALGAVTWVSSVACASYLLGREFSRLAHAFGTTVIVVIGVVILVFVVVRKRR